MHKQNQNLNIKKNLIHAHTFSTIVDIVVSVFLYLIITGITYAIENISRICSMHVLTIPFLIINNFQIDLLNSFRLLLNIWFLSSLFVTLVKHTIVSNKDIKKIHKIIKASNLESWTIGEIIKGKGEVII